MLKGTGNDFYGVGVNGLRSVVAVMVGYMIFAAIAPSRAPLHALHALLVALLIATGATVSLLTSPAADASWSQWGALIFMAPCAWVVTRFTSRSTS